MSGGTADRLRALATAGRTALWPLPVAAVVLALAAGVALPRLDRAVDDGSPSWITDVLFSGGPGAARTVLDAISSSMITVTSLTFSLTVVTLQLASSQFSPRLLRTFTRDRFVHATLAVFLATFTYALTVQRTVRSADEGGGQFVPRLSVTVGFVLTIASVISLVLFLAHLASEIRVETMLETVHRDASATARAVLGGPARAVRSPTPSPTTRPGSCTHRPPRPRSQPAGRASWCGSTRTRLLAAVVEADALLVVELLPGAAVAAGTPLAWAWAASGAALSDDVLSRPGGRVADAVVVGPERTEAQDVAFGLRQLTDVAVKALSPGINDPTTAVHALGHSSALLCELAGLRLGPKGLHEDAGDAGSTSDGDDGDGGGGGRLRVVVARPALSDLLDLAVAQPRRYGASDPAVLASAFQLLRAVAWCAVTSPRRRRRGRGGGGPAAAPAGHGRGRRGRRRPRPRRGRRAAGPGHRGPPGAGGHLAARDLRHRHRPGRWRVPVSAVLVARAVAASAATGVDPSGAVRVFGVTLVGVSATTGVKLLFTLALLVLVVVAARRGAGGAAPRARGAGRRPAPLLGPPGAAGRHRGRPGPGRRLDLDHPGDRRYHRGRPDQRRVWPSRCSR